MKIQNRLNNLFHQYDVEENRITNAFLQTLARSDRLLRVFLDRYFEIQLKEKAEIVISCQKTPFNLGDTEKDHGKIQSTPDGWIVIDDEIAIVFESKITTNAVNSKQLALHVRKARKYAKRHLCVITPDEKRPPKCRNVSGADTVWIPWKEIYGLVSEGKEDRNLAGYMERQLKEYLAMKDGLIGFQGIDYTADSFNTEESKIILKSLVKEVKPAITRIYPELKHERKTYSRQGHSHTISPRSVWSYLAADENFTKDIHLTLWLAETYMGMGLTIPNGAGARWKRLRAIFRDDKAFDALVQKLFKLRNILPNLYLEFVHRHYRRQSEGIVDGIIEINFDVVKGNKDSGTKANKAWLDALRSLIRNKRGYNAQLMLRTRFFYRDNQETRTANFKDTVIKTAESFKEIFHYLQQRE